MIFAIADHIEQIIRGTKTQTRRQSSHYLVGKKYSIQPCRTCKAIKQGKILIIDKQIEAFPFFISLEDAQSEGGYARKEFEELYEKLYPNWLERYAYTFRFIQSKKLLETKK